MLHVGDPAAGDGDQQRHDQRHVLHVVVVCEHAPLIQTAANGFSSVLNAFWDATSLLRGYMIFKCFQRILECKRFMIFKDFQGFMKFFLNQFMAPPSR